MSENKSLGNETHSKTNVTEYRITPEQIAVTKPDKDENIPTLPANSSINEPVTEELNRTGGNSTLRRKRSVEENSDSGFIAERNRVGSEIPNVLASMVIANGRNVTDTVIRSTSNQRNVCRLASAGAPVFLVSSPIRTLQDTIQSLMRREDLSRLKPYFMATSTRPISMDGGVHVPAAWSQKTLAFYSVKTDEYVIIYDPALTERFQTEPRVRNPDIIHSDPGSNTGDTAIGIYGRGRVDGERSALFRLSFRRGDARILPLTSSFGQKIDMLFVMNAGEIRSENDVHARRSGKYRNLSMGVMRVRLNGDDLNASRHTIERLHRALSSTRNDVFGIGNHPEGNSLVASVCFEITGEADVPSYPEAAWKDVQIATGSNAELVVNGFDRKNNITRVFGFIVDKRTKSQHSVFSSEFTHEALGKDDFKADLLLCGKPEFRYRGLFSESDVESTDCVDTDEDRVSVDTLSSTSYAISDDEVSTSDDAFAVESEDDDGYERSLHEWMGEYEIFQPRGRLV